MLRPLVALLLVAAGAGCYNPQLGPAGSSPFRCGEGACPAGYHCAQRLCIADGQPDPPRLVATTTAANAPPQPTWDGTRFALFWQQDAGGLAAPGLHYLPLDSSPYTDAPLIADGGDVAFAALYHPVARRFVLAWRKNDDRGDGLTVFSLGAGDVKPTIHFARLEPPAALGFSAPSLAIGPGKTATLAYTFGAPPTIAADNLFCTRLDLAGGPPNDSCRPSLQQTQGSFATEVALAEAPGATFLFWRERSVHVTAFLLGVELPRGDVEVSHIAHAVVAGGNIGLVAQVLPREPPTALPIWVVVLGSFRSGEQTKSMALPTFGLVPDVISDGERFIACGRDEQGELSLTFYSVTDLTQQGAALRVPRLSRAEIASCRLAAAPDQGKIAVAWQERVPPAFRTYASVVSTSR